VVTGVREVLALDPAQSVADVVPGLGQQAVGLVRVEVGQRLGRLDVRLCLGLGLVDLGSPGSDAI
jgi:hypothetical protein